MQRAVAALERYVDTDVTVILVGSTGCGKTLLAELTHWLSGRQGALVEISGPELASELAEDALFGHEPGAFTGALRRRRGLIEEAAGGTLLLDDFDRTHEQMQGKLLRVLQTGRYRAIGADRDSVVGCRFVVCLRKAPDDLVREGVLIPDLRYRLGCCVIPVPDLRDRRDEIPLLAEHFIADVSERFGRAGPRAISDATMSVLLAADWPGNVRHLSAAIEAAYLNAGEAECIEPSHLPDDVRPVSFVAGGDRQRNDSAIASALRRSGGNVILAARILGVHRNTVTDFRRRQRGT